MCTQSMFNHIHEIIFKFDCFQGVFLLLGEFIHPIFSSDLITLKTSLAELLSSHI